MWTKEKEDKFRKFIETEDGKKHMNNMLDQMNERHREQEQKRRDDIVWLRQVKDIPFDV